MRAALALLLLCAVPPETSSVVVLPKPPTPSASASAEASPPPPPAQASSPSPPAAGFTARDDSGSAASLLARTLYAQSQFLLPVPCREDLPHVFGAMGLLGNAAEIGVLRGEFSRTILEAWPGAKLYLVDPWAHQEEAYVDINNGPDQNYHEQNLAETLRNVQPWRARVQVIRGMSVDAANLLPDGHLSWAYIDADHSYSAVRADLRAWWPKIQEGGVLSGHDFVFDGLYPLAGEFGVMRAVLEHAAEVGRQVLTTFAEPGGPSGPNSTHCRTRVPSWYMRK
jgi:hypothetical protein